MTLSALPPKRLVLQVLKVFIYACAAVALAAFVLQLLLLPPLEGDKKFFIALKSIPGIFTLAIATALLPSLLFLALAWVRKWRRALPFILFGMAMGPVSFAILILLSPGRTRLTPFGAFEIFILTLLMLLGLIAALVFWFAIRTEWLRALSPAPQSPPGTGSAESGSRGIA